jgi:triphosphoribosyl-dephospho-CoA synthase
VIDASQPRLVETLERACVLEASAPKVGNVHPQASFVDLDYRHFVIAAQASSPALASAGVRGVGSAILEAARATREATGTNPNLGILLLLGPLSAAAHRGPIREHLPAVLRGLNTIDSEAVYAAIRVMQPGGLGTVDRLDVNDAEVPVRLHTAMEAAADYDRIARQYVTDFQDVLEVVVPRLLAASGRTAEERIARAHIELLALWPDSLVLRKSGIVAARQVQRLAEQVLVSTRSEERVQAERTLDVYLRADGHRRNPGTTADLIAAGLFIGLWEHLGWLGQLTVPTSDGSVCCP